jgi:hypothetical protein
VAHNLGAAIGTGGALFGRVAFEPSVRRIEDREQRGQVVNEGWRRFGAVQLGALTVMAATWYAGRSRLGGAAVSGDADGLVIAKDVLVGATVASAAGAAITGNLLAKQREHERVPMNQSGEVAEAAPPAARRLGRITDALGLLNLLAGAGVIGVTTVLAMKAGKSGRWWAVSRFLP